MAGCLGSYAVVGRVQSPRGWSLTRWPSRFFSCGTCHFDTSDDEPMLTWIPLTGAVPQTIRGMPGNFGGQQQPQQQQGRAVSSRLPNGKLGTGEVPGNHRHTTILTAPLIQQETQTQVGRLEAVRRWGIATSKTKHVKWEVTSVSRKA